MKKKILDGPTNMISRVFKSYFKKKKRRGSDSYREQGAEGCGGLSNGHDVSLLQVEM